MAEIIEWSDDYLIGLKEIDVQHKRLTEIVNKALNACNTFQTQKQIVEAMDDVMAYTKWHFQSEDILMRIYEYPDSENHRSDHVLLIKELHNKTKEAIKTKPSPQDLYLFFVGWFGGHAFGSDRKLAHFMRLKFGE
ncbi:MAG: bacteriohemerythrin [Magnetococcales bacterium]|nr:bacteriohemerythrin [Magnetococcales bacterium]